MPSAEGVKVIFSGGWLDMAGLLRGLGGWPLVAEVEEVFTPHGGGEPMRRTGRVFVDRRRRWRFDIAEGDHPAVMFRVDPARQMAVAGLADQPDTWVRSPWSFPLPSVVPKADPPKVAIDMEVPSTAGTYRYRLFNARCEDPCEGVFPEE